MLNRWTGDKINTISVYSREGLRLYKSHTHHLKVVNDCYTTFLWLSFSIISKNTLKFNLRAINLQDLLPQLQNLPLMTASNDISLQIFVNWTIYSRLLIGYHLNSWFSSKGGARNPRRNWYIACKQWTLPQHLLLLCIVIITIYSTFMWWM